MNTINQETSDLMKIWAEEYRKKADELSARISHLAVVSSDTAYRESYNEQALRRAQKACDEGVVFFSADGAMGVMVRGISALKPEKAKAFIAACGGWKSHANSALTVLDGERGVVRKNEKGTCWVIDLASSKGTVLFSWESGPQQVRYAGPRLNTTNGAAHWCGLVSETMPMNTEKAPNTVTFLSNCSACFEKTGLTPNQLEAREHRRGHARRLKAEVASKLYYRHHQDGVDDGCPYAEAIAAAITIPSMEEIESWDQMVNMATRFADEIDATGIVEAMKAETARALSAEQEMEKEEAAKEAAEAIARGIERGEKAHAAERVRLAEEMLSHLALEKMAKQSAAKPARRHSSGKDDGREEPISFSSPAPLKNNPFENLNLNG